MELRSDFENSVRHFGVEFFNRTKELRGEPAIGRYGNAIKWAQSEAEDRSWEYLGKGDQRIAVRIPDGLTDGSDAVVKASICRTNSQDGRYQTAMEVALWKHAPNDFAEFLAPVVAYGGQYQFVVMPYAEPLDDDTDISPVRNPIAREFGIRLNEFAPQNWGRLDGDPVLIDYGHNVIRHVVEDDQIPDVQEYAPEFVISETEESEEGVEVREEEEEDLAGVDASKVVVSCSGIRPNEKRDLRKALQNEPVEEGAELSDVVDGFEGRILSTVPTSGDGFGQSQVVITKDTLFQFK